VGIGSANSPTPVDRELIQQALAGVSYHGDGSRVAPLPTGFGPIDRVTGGGLGVGVHLFTGASGTGKTAWMLSLAAQLTGRNGTPTLLIGRDTPAMYAQRLISIVARTSRADLVDEPRPQRVADAVDEVQSWPLLMLKGERAALWEIGWALRELQAQAGSPPRLMLIDDLDRVPVGAHQIASLAGLAGAHELTIVVTTTLSTQQRDSPSSPVGLPDWSRLQPHLRTAWLIHRAELSDPQTPDRGLGQLRLMWQANGPTGTATLRFIHHLAQWTESR
jgi:replicative DNA helicase